MKKLLTTALSLGIAGTMLVGCSTDDASSTPKNNTAASSDSFDVYNWFAENENIWRTVENGAWSNDPKDAPTDEDLKKILDTASKTQSAIGWNPYYYIAVKDPAEQKAIIGDAWEGATSEGTVTVLILADQIADQEHHKDAYADMYMQSPVAYFDTGMSSGLLNITAYSLGYSTHYFASPNGTSIAPKDDTTFGGGQYPTPNYDISKFVEGKDLKRGWGMMGSEHDVEGNAKMIAAVVIGKADSSIDAKSAATQYARPSNWTIWDENK